MRCCCWPTAATVIYRQCSKLLEIIFFLSDKFFFVAQLDLLGTLDEQFNGKMPATFIHRVRGDGDVTSAPVVQSRCPPHTHTYTSKLSVLYERALMTHSEEDAEYGEG